LGHFSSHHQFAVNLATWPIPYQADFLQGSAKDLLIGIILFNKHFESNQIRPKGTSKESKDFLKFLNKTNRQTGLDRKCPWYLIQVVGWVGGQ
jgi:hypothetical protein